MQCFQSKEEIYIGRQLATSKYVVVPIVQDRMGKKNLFPGLKKKSCLSPGDPSPWEGKDIRNSRSAGDKCIVQSWPQAPVVTSVISENGSEWDPETQGSRAWGLGTLIPLRLVVRVDLPASEIHSSRSLVLWSVTIFCGLCRSNCQQCHQVAARGTSNNELTKPQALPCWMLKAKWQRPLGLFKSLEF